MVNFKFMPSPNHPLTRRQFLSHATVALTAALAAARASGKPVPRAIGQDGKLQHSCIGVGGMGWNDFENFRQHPRVQIVALCDVDADHLAKALKVLPEARTYRDWRELLAAEGDRIDSVNVTVPDHMHFPIAHAAIAQGKHVYCQKPMCHDVAEVRALTQAARKYGVVTQLGTQFASGIGDRQAVQLLRQGVIGRIQHAYLCSNRPGAEMYRLAGPRPAAGAASPANLDWELWLGNAPERPYVPDIYHPTKWRSWQDFGTGWSGDIGCHIFDAVWKGLELQPCTSVVAEVQESWKNSPERRSDTWPQGNHITWTFPGNEHIAGRELIVEWFDGAFYPPADIRRLYSDDLKEYPAESAMLIGTEGALLLPHQYPPVLLPEAKFKSVKLPELPRRNHYHHFADACLGGEMCESHFTQTGPMTETILLGTVAIRLAGQRLDWDHARMRVTNCREAASLLKRHYRKGWAVPGF